MSDPQKLLSQFYIELDGSDVSPELMGDLEQVTVESSLHLPDVATLRLYDPHLSWIDHASLVPGKALKITAKLGTSKHVIFDGEIVEIEPEFGDATQQLTVRAFDRLHRLARGRHARSFVNVNDGDLVKKLAQEVGLQAKVGPTTQVYPYVFQNNETNLAFLQRRAAMLGYLLFVDGKTLNCVAPSASQQPLDLAWGDTMYEFRPRMTTVDQVTDVTVRGWDPKTKQAVVGKVTDGKSASKVGDGQSGGAAAKKAFSLEAPYLVADRPVRTQAIAELQAQATADRHGGRFIEAEGVCGGTPTLIAGMPVKISGVGTRFGGTYFVTAATHMFQPIEGYRTQFSVSGLSPATLIGLLAPEQQLGHANGLVIGIVTDNQDPDGLGRVKVKYPWLSEEHASDWARVVSTGGGPSYGIEFLPEVNDEVLVGFEMGDIHYPYVLGGLWNGKDAPPQKSSAIVKGGKVQQRIIQSRSGHTLTFDDDDAGGGIIIKDKAGNIVTLDSKGKTLTIESKGELTIKSQGNLSLETQGNLSLTAQGSSELKGMGVKVDGGGGNVDVKGLGINLN